MRTGGDVGVLEFSVGVSGVEAAARAALARAPRPQFAEPDNALAAFDVIGDVFGLDVEAVDGVGDPTREGMVVQSLPFVRSKQTIRCPEN